MNQSEIKAMENEKLLAAFYWLAIRTANEENSKRGLTKGTLKEEAWMIQEISKRFGIDAEALKERINK